MPGSLVLAIAVLESRSIVSPPSNPCSASHTLPSESVNGADCPAFTLKMPPGAEAPGIAATAVDADAAGLSAVAGGFEVVVVLQPEIRTADVQAQRATVINRMIFCIIYF